MCRIRCDGVIKYFVFTCPSRVWILMVCQSTIRIFSFRVPWNVKKDFIIILLRIRFSSLNVLVSGRIVKSSNKD